MRELSDQLESLLEACFMIDPVPEGGGGARAAVQVGTRAGRGSEVGCAIDGRVPLNC